jgi:ankyrin repeat protein
VQQNNNNYTLRRESVSKSLWEENEIDISIRGLILKDSKSDEIFDAITRDNAMALEAKLGELRLNSLLLFASWKGALTCVNLLLGRGGHPNAADSVGRSCLHLAAINDQVNMYLKPIFD